MAAIKSLSHLLAEFSQTAFACDCFLNPLKDAPRSGGTFRMNPCMQCKPWYDSLPELERMKTQFWYAPLAKAIMNGLKVFRPSAEIVEVLGNIEVNLPLSDYVQPFPDIVMEYPESLGTDLLIPGEPSSAKVLFSCLHHSADSLRITHYLDNRYLSTTSVLGRDSIIEKAMQFSGNVDAKDVFLVRACVNYVFSIEEFGCKKEGPANPKHYARLTSGKKQTEGVKREIKLHPIIYGFERTVRLMSGIRKESDVRDESGNIVAPHWRRGHWRLQAHGPQMSLRKRIRIDPVLVNRSLFGGDVSSTKTTYK